MENKNKISKDKKNLTDVQIKRLEEFNRVREELLEQGYKEKYLSVSTLKANVMALVIAAPIFVICYLLFLVICGDAYKYIRLNMVFYLVAFLGIVVHELIHGLTWSLFCKKKWRAIGFGVDWSTLTPYCCCNEGLKFKGYVLGCAIPTILVGLLPYTISLLLGNYFLAMFGLFHILCGGGDMYILWLIRKEKEAIIVDHPYLVGCTAFEK
ncbi:DUF3267 domain-containing protein [Hathewaya histolytica]|uniref:Protein of uncharacterized function (DUF3267) n=1 Tax=Hathewaya histolytica TaxID=1498 RepID=A0A4U9R9H1_HATHI|nr:DUF3267 domain-containing protein [Hathewaya histolytica]VTQ88255.1 Protein of uncharacterised function (DUF3267) [Hathewaya histolytica]